MVPKCWRASAHSPCDKQQEPWLHKPVVQIAAAPEGPVVGGARKVPLTASQLARVVSMHCGSQTPPGGHSDECMHNSLALDPP
jgi:hypothetical protein